MGMRFLHGIFRFSPTGYHSFYFVIFSLVFGVCCTLVINKAYAVTAWFAVKDGGVMSGMSGTGVTAVIPNSQLPPSFISILIQGAGVGSNPKPNIGSIVVTGNKSVKTIGGTDTKDAYVKGIGALPAPSFFASLKQAAKPFTGNCQSMLTNSSLEPANLVYKIDTSCFDEAFNPLSGGYKLNGDGVVILYVTGSTLNINKDLKSHSDNERLIIISESEIRIGSSVGYTQGSIVPANYYSSTVPNIQASLISLSSDGVTIKGTSSASTERALIMEGPMYAPLSISFKRELPLIAGYNFPGVYVRYNPFYVAKLIEQLRTSNVSLPSSGVRWIYD